MVTRHSAGWRAARKPARAMRHALAIALALTTACKQETPNPDAPSGNHPPPRVIAGGGIGDGAIDGVVNLHVIDDQTRLAISGAAVTVGGLTGVTDATGLFVAEGLVGPQTVIAKATGYRSELWIGANGANLTINLQTAIAPPAAQAQLSGEITGFADLPVAAGHAKLAVVSYAQSDAIGDAGNNLTTPGGTNTCIVTTGGCPFTITTRAGRLGLIAAIFDRDLKGTADPGDDTMTLLRWAYRGGITVTDGVDQRGQDLALIDPASMTAATVDFGSPPAALGHVAALIGLDTASDGVYELPTFRTPGDGAIPVPTLAALGATGYRLTAIAQDASAGQQSVVIHRALSTPSLAAGTWLALPSNVTVTRTSAAWTAPSGATVVGVEYSQGAATVTRLLSITVLDGSTQVTLPDAVALPATGVIDAKLSAIGATGLDLHDFGLDADRAKLDRVAAQPVTLGN